MEIALVSFGSAYTLISTVYALIDYTKVVRRDVRDYGFIMGTLLHTVFRQAQGVIEKVRKHVLRFPDHEGVVAWRLSSEDAWSLKNSYAYNFNMTAVAGAILAQIAITALSLPYLESTHWTAEGAFVISLIAGLLSVYYACMVQQQLGDLQTPDEALRWMTTTRIYDSDGRYTILRKDAPIITPLPMNRRILPSYSSALLLVVPSQLLNWSSSSLLIGIGVYYGLLYTKHLGELRGDNANLAILLVYVLFTSGAVASYFWPWWRQRLEAADAAKGKYHRRQRGWSRHRHSGEWYAYGAASPSTGGASVASMQPAPPQNRVPPATSESAHDASLQIHTEPALDVNGHGSSDNAGSDGGGADIHQPRDDSPEEPEAEGTPPKPTRSQGRYNRADQAIIDALEASITAQKASCRAQETLLQTYLK